MRKNVVGADPSKCELFDKDADHVKHIVVMAGATLQPGQKVILVPSGHVFPAEGPEFTGVLDPFCPPVTTGEYTRMLIRPDLSTEVQHDFVLPGFETLIPESKRRAYDDYYGDYDRYDECRHCN